MLIGISGTLGAGKTEVAKFLTFQGFEVLSTVGSVSATESSDLLPPLPVSPFTNPEDFVEYVTVNWKSNYVISDLSDIKLLRLLQKKPFFLHVSVDAPLQIRHYRLRPKLSLEEFVKEDDALQFAAESRLIEINNEAQVKIINTSNSVRELYVKLTELNLLDGSRLRPTWDLYFMRLADLAALRSNCMKRRVGCVIVRDKRVIATGYNGTARNLRNCNEGGCPRCNHGQGSGAALNTCLCLHAEENALLEAGRDRIYASAESRGVLYCNTCPCLTCSIKIVQSGIKEVVYAHSYYMDELAHKVMSEAGIELRQFTPPPEGVFI